MYPIRCIRYIHYVSAIMTDGWSLLSLVCIH